MLRKCVRVTVSARTSLCFKISRNLIFSCMSFQCLSRGTHEAATNGAFEVRKTTSVTPLEYGQQDASSGYGYTIASLKRVLGPGPCTKLTNEKTTDYMVVSFPNDRTNAKTYAFKELVEMTLGEEVGFRLLSVLTLSSCFFIMRTLSSCCRNSRCFLSISCGH
jgi:hypothetical protein